MRDGVILRADVYRPAVPGRLPVLLQRTPYSKNDRDSARRFSAIAARGYVVVVQDTRGRYTSDGVARPHDEADDGYDSVQWAASLPGVNGRVGMFGGSYLATTQLQAATRQPPALVALFPASSYSRRHDMVFQGGAFYLSDGLGWNLGQAVDVRRRELTPEQDRDGPLGLEPKQSALLRSSWLWHLPLSAFNELDLDRFAPGYRQMLAHPNADAFWDPSDIESRHDRFLVPAFHLTGWYDTLLTGTLRNFTGLRANAATDTARRFQRLVVGPWTHARPTLATTAIGDVDFGPEAGFVADEAMLGWFDYWLGGSAASGNVASGLNRTDPADQAPVRLFVMGENRWHDEQEWPLARARSTEHFLHSGGHAATLSGDGRLDLTPPGREPSDQFTYDPNDPVPTGASGGYSRAPIDRRTVEQRPDVLVYTSAALTADVEVTGPLALTLWIASSVRDTDFTGTLVDVFPDGTARALADGILRARYRAGKTAPALLTPGEPTQITIDLGATSNLFRAGHRIRLEVSSSNFPRFDRNPNTGGVFAHDATVVRATQTILHDASHPSRLLLPVVPRQSPVALEDAVRTMTSLPAARLKLTDRGIVKAGAGADLVLFDPATVIDNSTFNGPLTQSTGIRNAWVNGTLMWDEPRTTGARPGPVITLAGHQTVVARPRARDLGVPFEGTAGALNAITDVAGVEVGLATIVTGEGALVRGKGPVRTGVTAVLPRGRSGDNVFAGWHTLNGNGEMTGTTWITEGGFLEGPILITNTHSVGIARDTAVEWMARYSDIVPLPLAAETYDGTLNDILGFHVKREHVLAALDAAAPGAVPEGNVGGGTGMIAFGFKGGTGTASRVVTAGGADYAVGALVQANFGRRSQLLVAGAPVGREIPDLMPETGRPRAGQADDSESGSIIVVIATSAPLLPHQLRRLAQRAGLGVARVGGTGGNGSGDIFVAFSTANPDTYAKPATASVTMLANDAIDSLFQGAIQATEEAIINAVVAAETMVGRDGNRVHALPHDRLRSALRKYNRLSP